MFETVERNENKFDLTLIFKRYETEIILGIIFVFYLFMANFFSWSQAFDYPFLNNSGGSDPYFNYYIIQYILTYHTQLLHELFLNYPIGAGNPRPPFFHWMIAFVATILSPIFGVYKAAYYAFAEFDAVFGALLIIPVYLMAKEAFGKKAGIIAAFLYALMPGNLSAGILTDGRMHTPELLFAFLAIYFFEMAIKNAKKGLFINKLSDVKSYLPSIISYYSKNKKATIYALLSGAALGGLMLSWQGYAYIQVIILIYVVVQSVINLLTRKPTGYLTYITTLSMFLGFLMGAYYYYGSGLISGWYTPEVQMAVLGIAFLILINIIGRKPWVITVPLTIAVSLGGFFVLLKLEPTTMHTLISGEGYFIKTRVYTTIAEAAPLPLGEYINSFGVAQFIFGMSGIVYVLYKYVKEKTDILMFILVFSLVSIYMSFEAARFNITAAPAYGILGGAVLIYFIDMAKLTEVRKRNIGSSTLKKTLKGNINWVHASFAIILVLVLIIPSGIGMVNAAIPENSASTINSQIYHELPPFLRANNSSNAQYFGSSGFYIANSSQPLAQSFAWLSTQNTNVPIDERPAYVNWWDYGFQEVLEGQHPTVADDFQQGYVPAGQILLSGNQSQILGVMIARLIKGYEANYHNFAPINSTIKQYLGSKAAQIVYRSYVDPASFTSTVLSNTSIYGNFINSSTPDNIYYGFLRGYLASTFSLNTLSDLYAALEDVTGYSIQYIQIDHNLFPFSGDNPGIFYAPAYLTDQATYTYDGEIVPYTYYQIYASTDQGTYPLNQLPTDLTPIGFNITYTPAFYNTSIYRFLVGYPPSAVGQSNGIPGISYGVGQYEIMPAWNMSNFELVYLGVPYNPYNNTTAHPNAWKIVPIQEAYTLTSEGKGKAQLLPPLSEIYNGADPIVAYYPGAYINGRVTTESGSGVGGVYVTIFDQYGIPHERVITNSTGYYNLIGLPGNDTVVISTGTLDPLTLIGSNVISYWKVHISDAQAEHISTSVNLTSGLPDYYIIHNFVIKNTTISGNLGYTYRTSYNRTSTVHVNTGTVILHNSTYNYTISKNVVNGQYEFNSIPPYDYSVSAIIDGKYYGNITIANTTVGGSYVYNAYVPMNTVNLTVLVGNTPINGLTIYVNGAPYNEVSAENGHYLIYLPSGNYEINAMDQNSTTDTIFESLSGWNEFINISANAYPVVHVSGIASNISTLKFLSDGNYGNVTASVDISNGSYAVSIPSGSYTVYGYGDGYAFLGTYTFTTDTKLNISGYPSSLISLESNVTNISLSSGYYSIVTGNSFIYYQYSGSSEFNISLPDGYYSIYSSSVVAGQSYSANIKVPLMRSLTYQMHLVNSTLTGIVLYNSGVSPSYDSNSSIRNGYIVLYSYRTPIEAVPITPSGYTDIVYASNTGSPSIKVISPYFENYTVTNLAPAMTLGMTPINIPIDITLYNSSIPAVFNGYVDLRGEYDYNLSLINGVIVGSVLPGIYTITIHNATNIIKYNDRPIAASRTIKLPVQILANVSSNLSNLYLFSQTGSRVMLGIIPVGTYEEYYISGSSYHLSMFNVTRNIQINNITTASGFYLNISNDLGILGNYTVSGNGYRISGLSSLVLPAGSYHITFSGALSNYTGSFYATGYSNVTLNANTNETINVTLVQVMTNLRIDTDHPYSTVYLYYNGSFYSGANANGTGIAYFKVPTRDYTVYALSRTYSTGYFGSLSISPFERSKTFNASMTNSYKVFMLTAVDGVQEPLNVSISSGNANINVNSSIGYIYLPIGNYTVSSQISSSESFPSETVSITFASSSTVYVKGQTYVNLNLVKEKVFSFSITQISKIKTFKYIIKNGTIIYYPLSYNFTIMNTGNSIVNITLSSGNLSEFRMIFFGKNISDGKLMLIPGQEDNVTANITPLKMMNSGQISIPVNITYNGGNTTKYLYANFPSLVAFDVSAGISSVNGTYLELPVIINNTGNANITVNLNISAAEINNLSLLDYSVKYPYNVTIPAYSSRSVNITLIPTTSTPAPQVSVKVVVSGYNTTYSLTLNASYPQLSKASVVASGNGVISNYTSNPYLSLIIGLSLIAVTVIVGLSVSAYRGRRRK
ncbi:hypothetical protein DMB44_06790 [Thermoplasma sp. Kam2015]|uniref:glycosyltransferase family 39 protein n=1 Tax=Thermoplasma sp. Kam2015 TaxID=2094122 RepID=UPI000D916C1D|nr:glycosyltransferase family 39 protein [Thermoplasma sp. Kam2015]PYB67877.1 hypothetical protein DMB44_06790 [Thermoplasma sp. Kam2015]